jgi:hypothetical protein
VRQGWRGWGPVGDGEGGKPSAVQLLAVLVLFETV